MDPWNVHDLVPTLEACSTETRRVWSLDRDVKYGKAKRHRPQDFGLHIPNPSPQHLQTLPP